ncbi:MAG: Hsp70 family protein [Pleurocapsa sp.]
MATNSTYAIDFGTSNTAIARWNVATQQAEIVKLPRLSQQMANLPPLIPSLLYVEDASQEKVVTGQQVRDRGWDLAEDPRFFRSFKRGIGTAIQGFLPELDGKTLSFERVGEWYLRELIAKVQADHNEKIDSLILTVPVDSFESYRNWLTGVCQSLDIEQVRIIDEPTSAALGYAAGDRELLLVVDFGGGTLDLSLVKLPAQTQNTQGFILKWGQKILGESTTQKPTNARVLAKAGQNLGGSDIDNWLVDYFAMQQGLPKSSLTTRLAERLKIQLSSSTEATEVYFNDETLETYELSLTRDELETILQQQQFFARLDDLMTRVLQQARRNGVEAEDLDAVLLVGGTAQIPAVQTWVKQYFPESKIKSDRPLEAIVTGALQLTQGIEVQDFLYHNYAIRYWNRSTNSHGWHPIIKTGQPYPMKQPVELFLGASVPDQPSIELIIGELAESNVKTEVYFDGDRLITKTVGTENTTVQPLNDRDGARTIARLNPLGNPGSDRLKLSFNVDRQRYLRLTIEDLLTQSILLDDSIVVRLK